MQMKQIPNLTLDSSIFHHFPSFSIAMYGYPTRPTLPQNLALSGNLSIHDIDDGGSNGHNNGEVQLEDAPPRWGKTTLPGRQD